jgi:hypothetical protein
MLSEGLATYVGRDIAEQGGFLPQRDWCHALASAQRLPSLADIQNNMAGFQGHVRYWYNYAAAACFVGDLFEAKGAGAFAALYPASNYADNYGAPLGQLDVEFQQRYAELGTGSAENAIALLAAYDSVVAAYERVLASPTPNAEAYRALDQARLAALVGDAAAAQGLLNQLEAMGQ